MDNQVIQGLIFVTVVLSFTGVFMALLTKLTQPFPTTTASKKEI